MWQARLCSVVCPTGNGVGGVRMTAGSCEERHGDAAAKRKKEMTENQTSTVIVENSIFCGRCMIFILPS